MENPRDKAKNLEAEASVLGAILLEHVRLEEAAARLRGPEFFLTSHRKIYACMRELGEENKPIDLVTLTDRLIKKGWVEETGGPSYLSKMASSVPTAANVEHYINIVLEKYQKRQLIDSLKEQLTNAESTEDTAEVISATQSQLEEIAELRSDSNAGRMISEIVLDVVEGAWKRQEANDRGDVSGAPSGFMDLDRMTAGFQKSDFIVVGARPSVGKTAFALNIGRNVAEQIGETVAIFSLEMSQLQLVGRMVCAEGNIDAGRFRTGNLNKDDQEKIPPAVSILHGLPIHIDDTPAITISEIRTKCRRIKKDRGLGMILIDYLQLIHGRGRQGESRQEEISHISRTLKQIARELEVPVIALSQLSRGVEQRQDKRPMLSDLRESGSIEQDADIVAFLYRDDYYDKETEKKNIIEIIIAKQRNGPVGTVELAFLKNFNKFVSIKS